MRKNKRLSWLLAVIFVFTTMLGAVPSQAVAADLSDISNHWAKSQIESLIERGVITGYPDNTFKPNNTITRAEFITMTNKAYSFTETATIDYTDVPASAWYAAEIAKAKAAGYIAGYEDGTMRPDAQITRQEAAKIISVIRNLDSSSDAALSAFTDAGSIPAWSRGYVAAMVDAKLITGYPDGTFKAANAINRAEAAVILGRTLGIVEQIQTVYDEAGTFGPASGTQTIEGDVTISADGVNLQNTVIKGNLVIDAAVGEGLVNLKNVTVTGTTTIKGGGTGTNGVTFENSTLKDVTVNKTAGPVNVSFLNGSSASKLTLNSAANVAGSGIASAVINASGVVFDTAPGSYTVKSGVTATIAGRTVTGTSGGGGGGGGGSAPVAVTGVTLNTNALTLKVGQTSTLVATIAPANATNRNLTWTSDHPGSATVNNGVVTAVGKGTATITVTTEDGSFTDTCLVTVTVPVNGISLSKTNLNMVAGGATATLIPVISPADADDKSVTWDSVDATVASVDANGVVTPIAEGTTAITATTTDGGFVASCTVTVGSASVAVTGVSLNYTDYTLNVGDSNLVLVPFIAPADATNTNVTWSTDAAGVATVNNGTVTAVGPGTAHITVTTADGSFTDTCTINVVTPVSGISLDITSITGVAVGDSDQNLTATITPAAADNKQVVWTTSNPAIATFIESAPGALTGVVRFIGGPGTATITATTVDGGYAASCIVNVGVRVSAVTLSPTTGTLKVGGSTLTLTPTASPASATDKSVTWSSSNDALATVAGGVVSPVAPGTVTITAAPNFKTAGATNGTATIDIFNVTAGTMISDDTLLAGKTVVSVQFTIDGPALPLGSIAVTLNDGTVLKYHSNAGGTYVFTGSTNTALASVTSANVTIRNAISFSLPF